MTEKPSYGVLEQKVKALEREAVKLKQEKDQINKKNEQLIARQRELAKNGTLFHGLFDNMPSGAAIYEVVNDGSTGSDYIIKDFNNISLKIEGKKLAQVIGKSLFALRPTIDDYGLIPILKKVWETGAPAYFPATIYRDEKFSNYYENYVFKIPSGEVVTIYNDVTDQKNVEMALKESKERFELAMQFTSDGIFDWDLTTNEIYYSPGWKRILGYENQEIKNEFSEWERLTKQEDVKSSWEILNELLEGKRNRFEKEFQMLHKDGHWVDILSRANVIFDKNGKGLRVVGTHVDITKLKQSERENLKLQAQLSGALEMAHLGHWEYDVANDRFTFNDHFYKMFRTTAEQSGGYTMSSAEYAKRFVHPDDMHLVEEETLKAIEVADPRFSRYLEHRILYNDGTVGHITVRFFIVKDADGKTVKTYGVNQDITERKKMEEALLHAQKLESVGVLAGGIAHDFNNILSSIMGFTELALDEIEKGTSLEDNLQEVYAAGIRARDLVKQILAFARQSDEEIKPVQVSEIAKEVLKFVRASMPTTIEIRQSIDSSSLIMGNATQVHQVLMNLCTNAAHAMENNCGTLELSLKDVVIDSADAAQEMELAPGDYIEIRVSDTGLGISSDIIGLIFEPYFTTKSPGRGTGIGLAMVHGIIKRYGGNISVDSTLDKGTVFTIHLPVTRKRPVLRPYEQGELPSGTENVLLVDDELPIAKMGTQILERLGYSVTTRTSSVEALELFRSRQKDFDLVITDVTMPNMTGDQLAIELMKIRPDIPVILCTGYSRKISDENATDIGIKAFAYKPIVKADLAKTVRKVLDEAKEYSCGQLSDS